MSELEKLLAIIESFRQREHDHVDEDNWYSCPCYPDYIGEDDRSVCLCGLAEHNAKVDEALQMVRGLTSVAADLPSAPACNCGAWAYATHKKWCAHNTASR